MTTSKVCSKCNVEKPFADFYIRTKCAFGVDSACKTCRLSENKEWRREKHLPVSDEEAARTNRKCYLCKQVQKLTSFYKKGHNPKGYGYICKPCSTIERRRLQIVRLYGITEAHKQVMFDRQNGRCVINNCPLVVTSAAIDHCHKSGVVRGLLCDKHNLGLGLFGDDPEQLRRAASYLENNLPKNTRQAA